jgi:hypothetical protein
VSAIAGRLAKTLSKAKYHWRTGGSTDFYNKKDRHTDVHGIPVEYRKLPVKLDSECLKVSFPVAFPRV